MNSFKVISGTTSGTIGTQTSHAHGLKFVPLFYWVRCRSNGVVYFSAIPDVSNFYVKGSAASLNFDILVVYGSGD